MRPRCPVWLCSTLACLLLTGCAAMSLDLPGPAAVDEPVEVTREVTRVVTQEVPREVTRVVTREVTRIVTREVGIEVSRPISEAPTPSPTPPSPTEPSLHPNDERSSPYIYGNASPALPEGEAGKVSVVVSRLHRSTSIASLVEVILRNNTDQPVGSIDVSAIAYSDDGALFAIGHDQGFSPRSYVAPGEIAMGHIYFDAVALPEGIRIEYEVEAKPVGAEREDLEVTECGLVENRMMGFLKNTGDRTISGPIEAQVWCFDENGELLGDRDDFTEEWTVDPGGSIPFQVSLGDDACPIYLVMASGFSW